MSLEDPTDDLPPDPSLMRKKPYEPPQLVTYGDIATVTHAIGSNGMMDGGGGGMGSPMNTRL